MVQSTILKKDLFTSNFNKLSDDEKNKILPLFPTSGSYIEGMLKQYVLTIPLPPPLTGGPPPPAPPAPAMPDPPAPKAKAPAPKVKAKSPVPGNMFEEMMKKVEERAKKSKSCTNMR